MNKLKLNSALIIMSTFLVTDIFSQSVKDIIKSAAGEIKNGNNVTRISDLNNFLNKEPENVVKFTLPFLTDSSFEVRQFAVNIFGRAGKNVTTRAVRQEVVSNLTDACGDRVNKVRIEAVKRLKEFNKDDFSDKSKLKMLSFIKNPNLLDKTFIKLVGFVNPEGLEKELNDILSNSAIERNEIKWAVRLALARNGNKPAIDYCSRVAGMRGVSDTIIYEIVPDLVYTRTYEATEFLVKILNSDEKNCKSSNPDSKEKITCAYRVMEYLAPVIEDYPFEVGASGDIKTDDYPEALKTVREWFAKQDSRYLIKNNSF